MYGTLEVSIAKLVSSLPSSPFLRLREPKVLRRCLGLLPRCLGLEGSQDPGVHWPPRAVLSPAGELVKGGESRQGVRITQLGDIARQRLGIAPEYSERASRHAISQTGAQSSPTPRAVPPRSSTAAP